MYAMLPLFRRDFVLSAPRFAVSPNYPKSPKMPCGASLFRNIVITFTILSAPHTSDSDASPKIRPAH